MFIAEYNVVENQIFLQVISPHYGASVISPRAPGIFISGVGKEGMELQGGRVRKTQVQQRWEASLEMLLLPPNHIKLDRTQYCGFIQKCQKTYFNSIPERQHFMRERAPVLHTLLVRVEYVSGIGSRIQELCDSGIPFNIDLFDVLI